MTEPAKTKRNILVAGATGKQGRALIAALRPKLLSENEEAEADFHVLALTRNPASPTATSLKSEPHVTVVQGDLDSEASVRKVFDDAGGKGGIWGVFAVLVFPGLGANADGEERQGELLANLALEYDVSHFVFSSVERGGEAYDDQLTLDRLAKVRIERHLKSLGEKGLKWTYVLLPGNSPILRPSFFMENFDGTIGKITATVLRCGMQPNTKLQLVAVDDVGCATAAVFKNSDDASSKILVITGDILTAPEQDAAYLRGTGKHLPAVPNFFGRILLAINGATKGLIADLERIHKMRQDDPAGYEAHMADARAIYPNMTTFEEWARHRKDTEKRDTNWNQVTVGKLVTGSL
ncbi:hypothetical protein EUX98_g6234 [Antrodiella citrinella]|uniref:NmrA-like domain-containing protein n=1 Tax=Antrodiella citrinella TaxID=2447956 RepID=A0A4S4MS71_9APHY|nr:hypothetical protein EUX98_g6234 [Antrodiella citrinella]